MALETLKELDEIRGVNLYQIAQNGEQLRPVTPPTFITVDHLRNEVTFKIQNGPIKEVGENGCQVDHLIDVAKQIIIGLNKKFPCKENGDVIDCLTIALGRLEDRKLNREARGVEGTSAK